MDKTLFVVDDSCAVWSANPTRCRQAVNAWTQHLKRLCSRQGYLRLSDVYKAFGVRMSPDVKDHHVSRGKAEIEITQADETDYVLTIT